MARRKNPSTIVWLALLGGAGVAAYLVTRKNGAAAPAEAPAPPQAPDELPEPELEEQTVKGGCYISDKPSIREKDAEAGGRWDCRNGVWKYKKPRTRPPPLLFHSAKLMV
jgi:hypothetical protein